MRYGSIFFHTLWLVVNKEVILTALVDYKVPDFTYYRIKSFVLTLTTLKLKSQVPDICGNTPLRLRLMSSLTQWILARKQWKRHTCLSRLCTWHTGLSCFLCLECSSSGYPHASPSQLLWYCSNVYFSERTSLTTLLKVGPPPSLSLHCFFIKHLKYTWHCILNVISWCFFGRALSFLSLPELPRT